MKVSKLECNIFGRFVQFMDDEDGGKRREGGIMRRRRRRRRRRRQRGGRRRRKRRRRRKTTLISDHFVFGDLTTLFYKDFARIRLDMRKT